MEKRRTFSVSGMHCAGCAAAVERAVKKLPVKEVYVNFASGRLNFVSQEGIPSDEEVMASVRRAGFKIQLPPPELTVPAAESIAGDIISFLVALFFTVVLLAVCMGNFSVGFRLNGVMQMILLLPVLIVGRGFFIRGIPALCRGVPNMDSLISCGAAAGIVYSIFLLISGTVGHLYFDAPAMILTLIMLGKMLEKRARNSASSAIRELMELIPAEAHLILNGKITDIPSRELCPGDVVRILPGEKIPADGKIISGGSFINESMLTGEELPVSRKAGELIHGGTLNVDGVLEVEITSAGQATMLGQIVKMISEAQNSRSPSAALADKVSGVFVWCIFFAAAVTAVIWAFCGTPTQVLQYSLSVLVAACPCSLGLATPVALISGIGRGAKSGILIKNGSALENAAKMKQIVFDKTGTLTSGLPEVRDIVAAKGVSPEELLAAAAAAEQFSGHPLAGAVRHCAADRGITVPTEVQNFTAETGRGVKAEIAGKQWIFGNEEFMHKFGVVLPEFDRTFAGATLVYGAADGIFCGIIAAGDQLRPEAAEAVKTLQQMGIRCLMLTGDNPDAAAKIAGKLALNGFYAGLLPQDKVYLLREFNEQTITGMVGDGINDAPALASGNPGIAVGSGSDAALESADAVLLHSDLREIAGLIRLSRKTLLVIRQNLFWAFFYNICIIPLAAGAAVKLGISLNPALCAAAMAASSLTVVLNALRLKSLKI